ncbi:HK97 family phage prohead protease [Aliiroseovarius marinus]|uniref:HK97 family phage prohead protease n=1 Tax=Aliiroseovarius marinus TaxID=2500159 RepID=UPI0010618456|nr:HK97 family phage prohead protease [Aliiroseovarius marinus]
MSDYHTDFGLEHKFVKLGETVQTADGIQIDGYASFFDQVDNGGDVVAQGAYAKSLDELKAKGRGVKMLWQHDPAQPIGIWDEVREDAKGLYVKGRILSDVEKGREAAALIEAGAIDGLSIGYRTKKSTKTQTGGRRLTELELWEVSLVTFPMLPTARVGAKGDAPDADDTTLRELAATLEDARLMLARNA